MPVDLSAWDFSLMLVMFLLGALIAAAVLGTALLRARQRNARLRRQVARLTTATALFSTPEHSRGDNGDAPKDQGVSPPAPVPESPTGHRELSAQPPWEAVEKEARMPAFPTEEPHEIDPTHSRNHDAMHGFPGIDAPTEPVRPEPHPAGENDRDVSHSGTNGHDQAEVSSFATEEAADQFRREYDEPMAETRDRIARLRAQLHEVPTTTTNGHGGPGGHL